MKSVKSVIEVTEVASSMTFVPEIDPFVSWPFDPVDEILFASDGALDSVTDPTTDWGLDGGFDGFDPVTDSTIDWGLDGGFDDFTDPTTDWGLDEGFVPVDTGGSISCEYNFFFAA